MRVDFEGYLDGFSSNVQEVLDKFKFRNQIPTLIEADTLGCLIDKFLDNSVNLSPRSFMNGDGSVRLEGLDNHLMATVFEELIRRFNEENNEEAGEHFTRYFYKPQPLRPLEEIRADILALERETDGLLSEIVGTGSP